MNLDRFAYTALSSLDWLKHHDNGLDFTYVFHSPAINIVFSRLTRSNQSCGHELQGAADCRLLGERVILELCIQSQWDGREPS